MELAIKMQRSLFQKKHLKIFLIKQPKIYYSNYNHWSFNPLKSPDLNFLVYFYVSNILRNKSSIKPSPYLQTTNYSLERVFTILCIRLRACLLFKKHKHPDVRPPFSLIINN
jgi:hypothetical protein